MSQITRILCPIDLSDASIHAIDYAAALAGWYKARLVGLYVYDPLFAPVPGLPPPSDRVPETERRRAREEAAACFDVAVRSGLDVNVVVDVGQPVPRILDQAAGLPADLIVMGTHGASGFEHLLLGSVTEKILRKAPCAVLTVPPRARATSTLPFRQLLCAVDFSAPSLTAVQVAFSLARESGAALTLLHVVEWPWHEPPPPSFDELPPEPAAALAEYRRYVEASATNRLEALLPDEQQASRPRARVVHGKSHVEILRAAADGSADLIVMGVHGRNALDMLVFGSTTNHVVRGATCPVWTIRQ
jgi:nucleotide-binding universal stress UspA family protein